MLTYGIVSKGLSFAAKAYLLQQDCIGGEPAFIKLVGLPKWFKVGTYIRWDHGCYPCSRNY
ncbi:MAG: hypothetical protein AB8W37_12525 [Arsenophonus endosymbiont of Dermacentor nuttalli]